jgi:tellurite resistance protein TerA
MSDKIIMTKGQKLTLDKPAGPADGDILIHTDWDEDPNLNVDVDVDLGVLYELKRGFNKKGVVQALGNSFGSLTSKPYIALDRDDRTGATSGETLRAHYRPLWITFSGWAYSSTSILVWIPSSTC